MQENKPQTQTTTEAPQPKRSMKIKSNVKAGPIEVVVCD